ncbi:HAD family phosphatase [Candidatus Roizmanbacteria bacterium]|nr:HAD family phosphatase [Candidatus Roizmanbacteria bacterium]
MGKYKAIISDIDGTLAPVVYHSVISDRVKKAIKDLNGKNFTFSLATGKPFFLIEHLIEELEIKSPVIVDNGAAIYDPLTKKPLWDSIIKKESADIILEIAKTYRKEIRASSGRESYELKDKIPEDMRPRKFVAMGLKPEEAGSYIKKIEAALKDVIVVRTSSFKGKDLLDVYVTNPDATKQHAVLKLAEILKISREEIIGIGDHYNDFPLLMACGLKVAMGNAVDDLKAIADYIAPSVEKDGVADVIDRFVLNNNR